MKDAERQYSQGTLEVRMIDDYIIPCYDALHTQSRERVTDDMIEYLNNKEALQ